MGVYRQAYLWNIRMVRLRAHHSISQTNNRLFKIAQMDQWVAVASGQDLIENIRTAPEHILSMDAAIDDVSLLYWS
jgi:hypothetical protein